MTVSKENSAHQYYLDITNEVCPMTFVRVKLLIEKMKPKERAEVRLQGIEPLDNVPRSVREIGHLILALEPEIQGGPADGPHRLILEKHV